MPPQRRSCPAALAAAGPRRACRLGATWASAQESTEANLYEAVHAAP